MFLVSLKEMNMEEKKIVFKSIDEQLAEDERRDATAMRSQTETSKRSSDKAVERTATGPKRGRKKLRLKKSARRTIGSLMLATSIVIGAIPTGGVSAGSPDTYAGSKVPAPDIATAAGMSAITTGDTTKDACEVKVTPSSSPHFGGFPIIPETDPSDPDKYVKRNFGKYDFYVVDYHGFKSEDFQRPIYSLGGSGGSNIEKYFEKNGDDDPYLPPSGQLNLVTGYVDTSLSIDAQWEFEDRLYKSELVTFSLQVPKEGGGYEGYGIPLYGRKISVYDKKVLTMHHVEYKLDDGTVYWEKDIVDGKLLSSINPPAAPPTKGGVSGIWTPTPITTDPVTGDLSFTAYYETPTPTATPPASPRKGDNGPDELVQPEEEDASPEASAAPEESTDGAASETPAEGETEANVPAADENTLNSEEGKGEPEVVVVESENADAGNFGLTGILLQTYNGTEYNDTPSEFFYACDRYAPITNICDNAFKGTENVNSVELPKNFAKIGNSAFEGCTGIQKITLGDGLSSIGASAFADCASLSTIEYTDLSPLATIGMLAFAGCTSLTTFSDSGSGFAFPKNLTTIGNGAFYGDIAIAQLDFSKLVKGCKVGNYAFNRCKAVTSVELDGTNTTVNNLGTVEGLFRECENLATVNMPDEFNGSMKKDTFGCCYNMSLIRFNNSTSGIAEDLIYNEFDNTQIIVEGPRPEIDSGTDRLKTPEDSSVLAYKDCLKVDGTDNSNNYTYRYRVGDSEYYDYCNVKATKSGTTTPEKNDFVFEVRNDGMITHAADRKKFGADLCDLSIGDTVGENNIFISGIDHDVFKANDSIVNLTLPTTIHSVGQSAFEECTELETVTVTTNNTTDGTDLKDRAFYGNNKLKKVTYKYNGDGLCAIRSECFKNCKDLDEVRFFTEEDGDYINGSVGADKDINKYAKFSTGGIAANAFEYESTLDTRDDPITFVGPMKAGYTPFLFAIGKGDYTVPGKISTKEVYILYKTENPRNLECTYIAQNNNATKPTSLTNPVYVIPDSTDSSLRDKYSDELLTSVPHLDNKGNFVTPAGVYLTKYPNRTSYIDQGKETTPVSVNTIDTRTGTDRTSMISAIVDQTTDITVPYGIDFIDFAESHIEDGSYKYYTFDKGNSSLFSGGTSMVCTLNKPTGTTIQDTYHMFAYVNGLKSVTFDSGSAWYIPSYAFEGPYVDNPDVIVTDPTQIPQSVEKITFNQDVKMLGELPFYCPDPEDTYARGESYSKTLPHNYRSPSMLETVNFSGENSGSGSKDNLDYSFINGIVKSNNGSDVTVEEILPGRGFLYKISSTTIGDVDANGVNELKGVTKFAPYAARDCDSITVVDLQATGADMPEGCFYDCDDLHKVTLPDSSINVKSNSFGAITSALEVYCPEKTGQYRIDDDAFEPGNPLLNTKYPDVTMHYHKEAEALEKFATNKKLHPNVNPGDYIADKFQLAFNNIDGTRLATHTIESGEKAIAYVPSVTPVHPTDPSMVFEKWQGTYDGDTTSTKFDVYYALYEAATFLPVYGSGDKIAITFEYDDGEFLDEIEIEKNKTFTEDMMPYYPQKYKGRTFSYISNSPVGKSFSATPSKPTVIHYEESGSSSSSSTSSTSSSGGGSTGGGGTTSATSSSSSSKSSSSSSSSAYPVYVNSQDVVSAPAAAASPGIGSTVYVDEGGSGGSGSGSTGKKGSGNATVISTTGGISDTGKISATVNGSTDNYVIKITQTPEADQMGLQALHGAYGDDITPIRYLPFDISLYDSTGTNKISPVPEGVSVSITMPIPDDLAIYGGNAKIASTAGGVLDPMTPRFTVINGVPCMTYTCTHFSPYMVWVDTANLTEAGIADMTPKTADGIHPKWFLCFGLAAFAVVLFLKKDPEEYLKKAA